MQCGLDEVAHQRMGFSRWVVVQLSKGNILSNFTSERKVPMLSQATALHWSGIREILFMEDILHQLG